MFLAPELHFAEKNLRFGTGVLENLNKVGQNDKLDISQVHRVFRTKIYEI